MKRLFIALLFLNGCATQDIDRADQNEIIKELYVSVESIKNVMLSSNVKTGIVGGAAVGVIDELDGNHEDMISGGLAGALVGGIFTALFEGSNEAYKYSLKSTEEGEFTLIQKELIDTESGCAKLRLGAKATLSSALRENCYIQPNP
ncbi:hypothetical protein PULV_a3120 [Pseudoalteromonas ulvae UL12]|uniref:Glycine zipper 2TM domain-containing protein n=1 Tax=Pseudoalteromonas ulvae TaxID=107327 RepID=A0A244CVE0_PSEDV|nr:hypothetical protein [Pseudoalteromonas ulvae]MBE0362478.1 hypothetical protein [Pseudoalteromonas ulvae UL12]OUL59558.1 hypothetical protein B1199_04690 [Pseudoalteromonas ulvae]